MTTTEVVSVGDELAIILPPEALKHLNVDLDDIVYITVQANSIYLSAIDREARMLELA